MQVKTKNRFRVVNLSRVFKESQKGLSRLKCMIRLSFLQGWRRAGRRMGPAIPCSAVSCSVGYRIIVFDQPWTICLINGLTVQSCLM
ncbi:hypothetical protein BA20089_00145 [Bifidobacterium asteroides DSM 20089]|uniref:Uncharacterized protein n=1 Tax=Bifidobacterium asteroides DSM 20089 TaxID=1437594 RepID=A0AAD0ADF4_9BIFI|nr:hypothetical protein BA20089_00145 [Bifidobacterium asteroides DSM 20089]